MTTRYMQDMEERLKHVEDQRRLIGDMEGEDYSLVQNDSEIDTFNEEWGTDYVCFIIEWVDGCADKLWGCYSYLVKDWAELVAIL